MTHAPASPADLPACGDFSGLVVLRRSASTLELPRWISRIQRRSFPFAPQSSLQGEANRISAQSHFTELRCSLAPRFHSMPRMAIAPSGSREIFCTWSCSPRANAVPKSATRIAPEAICPEKIHPAINSPMRPSVIHAVGVSERAGGWVASSVMVGLKGIAKRKGGREVCLLASGKTRQKKTFGERPGKDTGRRTNFGERPGKDTGRRTKGTTACCSPQNNLSISRSYRYSPAMQPFFLKNRWCGPFYVFFGPTLLWRAPFPPPYSILRAAAGGILEARTAGKSPATRAAKVIHKGKIANSAHG